LGKAASPRTVHGFIALLRPLGRVGKGQGEAMLMWSLRGIVYSESAFYLSRQRHGAGMNQVRLHHHATAIVCGRACQQKIHAGQTTRHQLFHCHTPP
jgi:hypothetical protein